MKTRELSLIGDFYHQADYIKKAITPLLEERNIDYLLEEEDRQIPWNELKTYDLFILSKAGNIEPEMSNIIWMQPFHQQSIYEYVKNGGSLIVLHSGLAAYPVNGLFREVVKGDFIHHPEEHPIIRIKKINNKHSIIIRYQ